MILTGGGMDHGACRRSTQQHNAGTVSCEGGDPDAFSLREERKMNTETYSMSGCELAQTTSKC